ncbi:hypothetical protein DPMN_079853 [Dreissena polymorpha]|uniref:Uncharacterized protein n=1 Tax=Dreissena polymorpha TaxID=45954 RepID=A0A9D4BTC0_DREPO|nr:hypothetical protein DPMN_079853 [Dreissena polymorpha]
MSSYFADALPSALAGRPDKASDVSSHDSTFMRPVLSSCFKMTSSDTPLECLQCTSA